MLQLPGKYLFFHGAIVILAGLIAGFPMWLAIIQKKPGDIYRAWRVAHTTLIMDGLLMVITGLLMPFLFLGGMCERVLVWSLVVSGYAFVFALFFGAMVGIRGLTPKPYGLNTIFFFGHIVGATGSLIGIALIIYGSLKAL